jgi:hypothetical protein
MLAARYLRPSLTVTNVHVGAGRGPTASFRTLALSMLLCNCSGSQICWVQCKELECVQSLPIRTPIKVFHYLPTEFASPWRFPVMAFSAVRLIKQIRNINAVKVSRSKFDLPSSFPDTVYLGRRQFLCSALCCCTGKQSLRCSK